MFTPRSGAPVCTAPSDVWLICFLVGRKLSGCASAVLEAGPMFLPFRQVALVFALGASLIALPLESACAAEAAGKKAVLVPIKAGSTAAKARTAQTKNVKSKQASVKKVSIKTAAKNTRQQLQRSQNQNRRHAA